jgi:hypothetical protein
MKIFLATTVFLMTTVFSFSQVEMGKWRMHISPYQAIDVAQGNNAIYTILSRGLMEYDLDAGEKTIWTAANYLSDVSPSAIAFDDGSQSLLIGYETGNLDIIQNERVINIPAIVQSTVNGVKSIENIICHEGNAYLATGVGIVVINLAKQEVRDTYNTSSPNELIIDIAIHQDSLFALTKGNLRVGALSNQFLADPGQWNVVNTIPDYSSNGGYNSMVSFGGSLIIGYNNDGYNTDSLFQYINGQPQVMIEDIEIIGLSTYKNDLMICTAGNLAVYDDNLTQKASIFQYQHGTFPEPKNALFHEGKYYIADGRSGLVEATDAFNSNQIIFEGPENNDAYRADWQGGKLAVAGGGLNGTGPSFSRKGGYYFENEEWTSINPSNQTIIQGVNIWDYVSVSVNPSNPEDVAFGTYSEIPLITLESNSISDTFGYSNSLLESSPGSTGWGYVTDLQYDDENNLWVANAYGDQPLKVRSSDGSWFSFDLGNSPKTKLTRRIVIDNNGVKWMGVDGAGVVAFDHGENIDDASDDRYRVLNTGENSGALPTSTVEAIEVDFDNNIWVGTPEGMRVLYNSNNVFDANSGEYNFQKLLIEFGENVEIVLGTTHITDIEIDGANRKWIGTASSGVFLLSADGLEVERTFTTEDSPLLSNNILDIAIDQNNGEVFFVTNEGLISYRSDASQGDLEYTNVNVFPNPVHPNYYGPITIQGIAFNSDVKITDIAGNLVYQTTSNGGTATWNGNTLQGQRAATGVYLIWTSIDDPETKGRKVGKVVFIN